MDQWMSSGWNTFLDDFSLPHIVVIILATLIILSLLITYYVQNKNYNVKDKPKTFSIGMEKLVDFVKTMVVESFGPSFVKLTPFFIFLFFFLFVLNIFAIFGIKEATTSYTVPLTIGFMTWITSIFYGVKYQRLSFLKKLCFCIKVKGKKIPIMVNPIEVMGVFTPLISLTFRIWGNIIAGAIIYSVLYWALGALSSSFAMVSIIIGGVVIMPLFMGYLSLFIGYIQAYVFTLLSITYVSMPINEALNEELEQNKHIENNKSKSRKNKNLRS